MCSQPLSAPVPFFEGQILIGLLTPYKEHGRQSIPPPSLAHTQNGSSSTYSQAHTWILPPSNPAEYPAPFHVNIWWPEQNSALEVRYQVSKAAAFCCNMRMQKAQNLAGLLLLSFHGSRKKTVAKRRKEICSW